MLLLLLLLPAAHGEELPTTLHKSVEACPSVGYFFERQQHPGVEPGPCYLCYCKGDDEAVCMLRDSDRCNEENYSYQMEVEQTTARRHRRRKHRRRSRRSAGLVDIFFKNKKKDEMMKNMIQESASDCTPKSSKSIGCPPKDWCEGCLVCDCDQQGQWQCHVMSFCDNKTPRPRKKFKKKNKQHASGKDETNATTTNDEAPTTKTNLKRSVNVTANRKSRKGTDRPFMVRSRTTASPTMTTKRTTTTELNKPIIGVKTRKAFKLKKNRKNENQDVVVIKKYISTLSPLSPELLKYKNNPQKLAQILYQQYDSTTKTSNLVKREIKPENRSAVKTILTNGFPRKNKSKTEPFSTKSMGDKILTMKLKPKLNLKNNARGRKPMNVKEHNARNFKIKAKKSIKKNASSFYSIQKEILDNTIDGMTKKKYSLNADKLVGMTLIPKRRLRKKRDLLIAINDTDISTNMDTGVNTSFVNNVSQSDAPVRLLTRNEEMSSSLNNYVYDVDNLNTPVSKTKEYDTTLMYQDTTTNSNLDSETESVKFTEIVNGTKFTEKFNVSTVTPNEENSDFQTTDKMIPQNNQMDTIYTTTTFTTDLTFNTKPAYDQRLELTKKSDQETTTSTSNILIVNEKQQINNTKNMKISNEISDTNATTNAIKKVYSQDKSHMKQVRILKTNENINNSMTVSPNTIIDNRTLNFIKSDLESMLKTFTNNSTKNKPRHRMMAVKYLKKLYSKLFSNRNNKTQLNNVAVMESICDTFGPCKISTNSVEAINMKISQLIAETKRALNIIAAIKGLLETYEGGQKNTGFTTEEAEFKSYVKKLNAILTDNHYTPLTESQKVQIEFIKKNTKNFIDSIGKFAVNLNDILKIIHTDKIKYDALKKRKILVNKVTKQKTNNAPIQKIKSLFVKFNLLQNTFMRNMYQAITELEKQNNQNNVIIENSKNDQKDKRYKMSVNKYMNKISYNLAKLRDLALKMSTNRERVKRYVMGDEDAVEYLLTLMEYLLKHNNPLDHPPVTDGIDLLIDAIRRAPDIKPIKKQDIKSSIFKLAKESSKSSSESEDASITLFKNHTENLKDYSFERPFINETQVQSSNSDNTINNEIEEIKGQTVDKTTKKQNGEIATGRYVDVEDMAFNGGEVQNVYMATYPSDPDDFYSAKENAIPTKRSSKKSENKYILGSEADEEKTYILTNATDTASKPIKVKTQFDLLNEEYENQLKLKTPSTKTVKIKHRKQKRLRKKSKANDKNDVSSITKELDDERTKKVVAEEAMLRKHMLHSVEYDPFKLVGEESASRDVSPLDTMNNDIFHGFYN